jgi:hypothetical protein
MRTPYVGRADLGEVEVTVAIENVDARAWQAELSEEPSASFREGQVVVTLLDQPRPGWFARAVAERRSDGSGCLIGASHFRPPL